MEDNEGIARLLQKRLERVGFTIDLAPDGEAGLEMSAQHPYDIIIVDYNMPVLNGLQVIQRLSERTPMPPTIMLTGTGNEQIAVEALKLGAYDYVVKDIDAVYLDLLPTVVEQGLQTNRLLRDKRLAEEKLEQSEKYYRTLIENSPDLIVLIDSEAVIRYISPAFRKIFGFDEQEIIGIKGVDLLTLDVNYPIDEQSIQVLTGYYQALLESSNQPMEIEFQVQDRQGSWRWLEIRGRNLLSEPWIESMVFNVRDITERKQAEEALRESEERFRMLFELAPDPYFINDLVGNLIDCNQAVEPLLGLSKTQLIGKNFVDMQIFDLDELGKIAAILVDLSAG
jgi:PAS domain S-box-containing protein